MHDNACQRYEILLTPHETFNAFALRRTAWKANSPLAQGIALGKWWINVALQGQKHDSFALTGRYGWLPYLPGRCPGLFACRPYRPLISLNFSPVKAVYHIELEWENSMSNFSIYFKTPHHISEVGVIFSILSNKYGCIFFQSIRFDICFFPIFNCQILFFVFRLAQIGH